MDKKLTTYGECPRCGQSCQPDFDQMPDANGDYTEYAVCCDCEIVWGYQGNINDDRETHHEVWEPLNIEEFNGETWYECR